MEPCFYTSVVCFLHEDSNSLEKQSVQKLFELGATKNSYTFFQNIHQVKFTQEQLPNNIEIDRYAYICIYTLYNKYTYIAQNTI